MPNNGYVTYEKEYDEAKLREIKREFRGMRDDFGKPPQRPEPAVKEVHVTFH